MATLEQLYEHLKTLMKQWFYEKNELDTILEDKADTDDIPTNTSDLVNDGDGTNSFLTQHQDISGKANITDLSNVATSGSYLDLNNVPSTFAPSSHTHSTGEISDSNAYSNLGTSANATQSTINNAINTKIGSLLDVDLLMVVDSLPTASANTMNKLYLVAEAVGKTRDNYEVFVTVRTGTSGNYSYDWEKVDNARIEVSGFASVDHIHGNISNDGKVGSNADYFVYTTTGGAVTSKQKIGNIDTSGAIGSVSGKLIVTSTGGVLATSDMVSEMDNTIQDLITYGNSL